MTDLFIEGCKNIPVLKFQNITINFIWIFALKKNLKHIYQSLIPTIFNWSIIFNFIND